MTAEGFLKPCLQFSTGADLRELLRTGADDEEIQRVIERIIYEKPRCHQFEKEENSSGLEQREMSRIGG